jgi:hypothetical protein
MDGDFKLDDYLSEVKKLPAQDDKDDKLEAKSSSTMSTTLGVQHLNTDKFVCHSSLI